MAPAPWMPGLLHHPGLNAGYRAGTNRMRMVVDHWTAGVNSYAICKDRGLCQFLLPKQGVPWQFAEVDAKCWHAGSAAYGNYNGDGPGIEVERMGGHEPLTADQTLWLGRINAWLESEWGVPNVHYWGPQFPWQGADFHGHVNHAQLHPNSDGLSPEEWASLDRHIDPAPTPPGGNTTMFLLVTDGPNTGLWMLYDKLYYRLQNHNAIKFPGGVPSCTGAAFDPILATLQKNGATDGNNL